MSGERTAVLGSALKDLLAGPRGIAKSSHVWLPLSLVLLSDSGLDLRRAFSRSLYLLLAVACKVQFSIQINDLSDREDDRAAGKRRWNESLSRPSSLAVAVAFIVLGLAAAAFAGRSPVAILAYAASTLLGLFYSLPPVRFKERGLWGLAVYALSATLIFVVVPWAWFDASPWTLVVLALAVYSDKWVQVLFHQIADHRNDRACGTRTFAVHVGLERARSALRGAAVLASLMMVGLWLRLFFLLKPEPVRKIVLLLGSAAVMAASAVYVKTAKRSSPSPSALVKELPCYYLGLTYLLFFALPPLGFVLLALKEPLMGILAVLSVLSLAAISRQSLRYRTP